MAKKKWGQNFLINHNVVAAIVQAADIQEGDSILEIGPGHGMLTRLLLEHNSLVTAVEVDPELCIKLRRQFEREDRFTLLESDVLEFTSNALVELVRTPAKVVANLPYNIATPLLIRLLSVRQAWQSLTLMVQLEVAERLCATVASGKSYGPLSLVGALGFEREIILIVPPDSFKPAPKVDSAVIHLTPRISGLTLDEEKSFLKWSRILFQQRRKILLNGIRQHFPKWFENSEDLLREKYQLRRPENLEYLEWLELFKVYLQNGNNDSN